VLQVLEVDPGGPCHSAVKVGDVITHVGGIALLGKSMKEIVQCTTGLIGSKTELILTRGNHVIP
jgi:C-terminal processing protease CtpA/Prc